MRSSKVHIIESPSAEDIFDDRHEGQTLRAALRHAGVPARVRTVVNLRQFARALVEVGDHADRETYPIIHFSMHGNSEGLGLTDNTTISWSALGEALCDINKGLGGALLVCMSTCHGFNGIKMAHRDDGDPFFALVGPRRDVNWNDTVAAFGAFYHHVVCVEHPVVPAVQVMNAVVATDLFACERADKAKEEWQRTKLVKAYFDRIAKRVASAPEQQPAEVGQQFTSIMSGSQG